MAVNVREGSIEEAMMLFHAVPEFHENPDEPFPTGEEIMLRIREQAHMILIAEVDEQMAGAMIGYDKSHDGSAYCWLAGVDPNLRRNGALKSLMEELELWSQQKGFDRLTIATRNSRRSMLAFLVRHDFLLTGVRENPKGALHNRIDFMKPLQPKA